MDNVESVVEYAVEISFDRVKGFSYFSNECAQVMERHCVVMFWCVEGGDGHSPQTTSAPATFTNN